MRWDYSPLDINPIFPGLGEIIIITIIIIIITIVIIISIIIINQFNMTHPCYMVFRSSRINHAEDLNKAYFYICEMYAIKISIYEVTLRWGSK